MTMITRESFECNDVEDTKIWWHEDINCNFNWFRLRFLKVLPSLNARSNQPSKYFPIFAVVHANFITVYGSPIQASGKLHQSFRRAESKDRKLGAFIPIILVIVALFVVSGWAKVFMAKRRRNREASKRLQEPTAAEHAGLFDIPGTGSRNRYSNAPGTGRTWQTEPRLPEPSVHSMSAFTNNRNEHIILREMEALPTHRPLHHIVEGAEDPQQFRRPSAYPMLTHSQVPSLENHVAYDSSSSSALANSHRFSGSGIGVRVETANNRNTATSHLPSEAPPPYAEAVGQGEANYK